MKIFIETILVLLLSTNLNHAEEVDKRNGKVEKNELMDDSNPSASLALKIEKVGPLILITSKIFTPTKNHTFITFDKLWRGLKTHVDIDGEKMTDPSSLRPIRLKDTSSEIQVLKPIEETHAGIFPLQMEGNMIPITGGGKGQGSIPIVHWAKKVEKDNCRINLRIDSENDIDIDDYDEELEDCLPGKLILVNDADVDDDLFKDFADGFDFTFDKEFIQNAGEKKSRKFIKFELDTTELPDEGTVTLVYDASDPLTINKITDEKTIWGFRQEPASGYWRVWIVDGDQSRKPESFLNPLKPGHFFPANIPVPVQIVRQVLGGKKGILYLECIRQTPEIETAHLLKAVYNNSVNSHECLDSVTISGITVEVPTMEVKSLDWIDFQPIKIEGLMFTSSDCKSKDEWWDEQFRKSEISFTKYSQPALYFVKPEIKDDIHERLEILKGEGDDVVYKVQTTEKNKGQIRVIGGYLSTEMNPDNRDENNIDKEYDTYTRKQFTLMYGTWFPICRAIYEHEQELTHLIGRVNLKKSEVQFNYNLGANSTNKILYSTKSDSTIGTFYNMIFEEGKLETKNISSKLNNNLGNSKSVKFEQNGQISIGKGNSNKFMGIEPGVTVVDLFLKIKGEEDKNNFLNLVTLRVNPLTFIEKEISHLNAYDKKSIPPLPGERPYSFFFSPYYGKIHTVNKLSKSAVAVLALSDQSLELLKQTSGNSSHKNVHWSDYLNLNSNNVLDKEITTPVIEKVLGNKIKDLNSDNSFQALQRLKNVNAFFNGFKNREFNYMRHIARSALDSATLNRLKYAYSLRKGPENLATHTWTKFPHIEIRELDTNFIFGDDLRDLMGAYFKDIRWSISNPFTEEIVTHMIRERAELLNETLKDLYKIQSEPKLNNVYFERANGALMKLIYPLDSKLEISVENVEVDHEGVKHIKERIIGKIPDSVIEQIKRQLSVLAVNGVEVLNNGKAYIDAEAFSVGNGYNFQDINGTPDFEFNFYVRLGDSVIRFGKVNYNFRTLLNLNNRYGGMLENLADEIEYLKEINYKAQKEELLQYFKDEVSWVTYYTYVIGEWFLPFESINNLYYQTNIITGYPIGVADNALAVGDLLMTFVPGAKLLASGKFLIKSPKILKGAITDAISVVGKSNPVIDDISKWGSDIYKSSSSSAKTFIKNDLLKTKANIKRLISTGPNTLKHAFLKITKLGYPDSARDFFAKTFLLDNPHLLLHTSLGYGMIGADSIVRKSHAFTGTPGDLFLRNGTNLNWQSENAQHVLEALHSHVSKIPTTAQTFSGQYLERLGVSLLDDLNEIPLPLKNTLTNSEANLLAELLKIGKVTPKQAAKIVDELRITACFEVGTKVLMADGSSKNIEDLRVDDFVLSRSEKDPYGKLVAARVNAVAASVSYSARKLFLKKKIPANDSEEDFVLHTTDDHPFWSVERNFWQRADNLAFKEELIGLDENVVFSGSIKDFKPKIVYCLAIDQTKTYFVLAENDKSALPVWVHNAFCSAGQAVSDTLLAKGIKNELATNVDYVQTIININLNKGTKFVKFDFGTSPKTFLKHDDSIKEARKRALAALKERDAVVKGYQCHHYLVHSLAKKEYTSLYKLIHGFPMAKGRYFPGMGFSIEDANLTRFLRGFKSKDHLIPDKNLIRYSDEFTHDIGHTSYTNALTKVTDNILNDLIGISDQAGNKIADDILILNTAAEKMQRLVDNIDNAFTTKGSDLVLHANHSHGVYTPESLTEKWVEVMSEGL